VVDIILGIILFGVYLGWLTHKFCMIWGLQTPRPYLKLTVIAVFKSADETSYITGNNGCDKLNSVDGIINDRLKFGLHY
jgi:hypothetical protein